MLTLSLSGDDALEARLDGFAGALGEALAAKAERWRWRSPTRSSSTSSPARSSPRVPARCATRSPPKSPPTATLSSRRSARSANSNYAAIQEYGGKTGAHESCRVKGEGARLRLRRRDALRGAGRASRFDDPRALVSAARRLDERSDAIVAALAATPEEIGARMSREAAFSALFAAVSAAYPWGVASRRMKLWSEVPRRAAPGPFPARSRAGDLPMVDAGGAEADAGSEAVPLLRRPRSDDAGRERDQRRARRARRRARARRRRPRARPPDPRRRRHTIARSTACRCATPATSTATRSPSSQVRVVLP